MLKSIQKILSGKDVFLFVLEENIREELRSESAKQIAGIDHRLEELFRLANSKTEYGNGVDEIQKLRAQRQNVLTQDAQMEGRQQRIEEMGVFGRNRY